MSEELGLQPEAVGLKPEVKKRKSSGAGRRADNARPMEVREDRPTKCPHCGVEGPEIAAAYGKKKDADGKIIATLWRCQVCKRRFQVRLEKPQKRGNKPGSNGRQSLPGHRRVEDKKGQRIDLLTETLSDIVGDPNAANLNRGATVLSDVRADPF